MQLPGADDLLWPAFPLAALCRCCSASVLLALVGCSGGGSGDQTAQPASPPLQTLRELRLLAGSLENGYCGSEDGTGTAARLSTPGPIAVDSLGNVTALGDFFSRLRTITPQGVVSSSTAFEGGAPLTVGNATQFYSRLPVVAFGPDNSRYLASWRDLRPPDPSAPPAGWVIFRRDPDGREALYADPDRQAVRLQVGKEVSAMAFDSQQRLLVADTQACAVRRVEPDQTVTTALAATGLANCTAIHALAVDANGTWAYALSDGSVRRRSPQGVERTVAGITTGPRVNLAFDARGRLIIGDRDGKRLLAEAEDGTVTVLAANVPGPERPLAVSEISGVAADRSGQVFFSDARNCTISRIDSDGRVSVLAGMGSQNGFRDGAGPQARLGAAFRISVDPLGVVYVSDPANRVVRRIDAAGNTSTFAGTPETSRYDQGMPRPPTAADLIWQPGPIVVLPDGPLVVYETEPAGFLSISTSGVISPASAYGAPAGADLMATGPAGVLYTAAGQAFRCTRPCTQQPPSVFAIWQRAPGQAPVKLLDQDSSPLLRAGEAFVAVPKGLAVAADGSVYFSLGHAVFRRDVEGRITLVAGGGEPGYRDSFGAGARDVARFSGPSGLALDPGAPGVVYVADTVNHLVRKINAAGEVSTVLGTPGLAVNQTGLAPAALRYPREVQVVRGGLVVSSEAAVLVARE